LKEVLVTFLSAQVFTTRGFAEEHWMLARSSVDDNLAPGGLAARLADPRARHVRAE